MYIPYGLFVRIGPIGSHGFPIPAAFSAATLNSYSDISIRSVAVNRVSVSVCLWALVHLVAVVWRRSTM